MKLKSILGGFCIIGLLFFFFFDARNFSDPIHDLGRFLIGVGIPLKNVVTHCPTFMKHGCIHGAVMEYLDKRSVNTQKTLAVCDDFRKEEVLYTNCIHGVGHYIFMESKLLTESLVICDSLPESIRPACFSGVFMEYSIGGHPMHRHGNAYQHLPCSDLDTRYQRTCYASEGSYRQYRQGFETFEQSFSYCDSIPHEYQRVCSMSVAERKSLSRLSYVFLRRNPLDIGK